MYTTESYTTSIAVSDYKKRYIDIPTFTEYCKACPNYDRPILGTQNCRYYVSIPPITVIHSVYSLLASPFCH